MRITSAVQATIVLQIFSTALCQFPMQFPYPQMGSGMGPPMGPLANMAPMPPLAPQPMFNPPMPMNFQMPQKMASVVMPFFSKSADKKKLKSKKRKSKSRRYLQSWDSDTDTSGSSSDENFDFRRSRSKKRRQVLTPVVSYVTKDGYVVYQKKIKKDKAKDWLEMTKKLKDSEEFTSAEERKFQQMLRHKKKKRDKYQRH